MTDVLPQSARAIPLEAPEKVIQEVCCELLKEWRTEEEIQVKRALA